MEIIRAIKAESLKLKRTRALWLTIAAPLFVALLNFIMLFNNARVAEVDGGVWDTYIISANMGMWYIIMNTLYLSLMIALVIGSEHTANTWKYLLALPISRSSLLLAKLIIVASLGLLANFLLILFAIGSGFIAEMLRPELSFTGNQLHLFDYIRLTLLATALSSLIIIVHVWLSIRIRNFIIPVGIGFLGAIATLIATSSGFFQRFWIWMYPMDGLIADRALTSFEYHGWPLPILLGIVVVAVFALTLFAVLDLNRRDIN